MRVKITIAVVIVAAAAALFFLSGSGESEAVFYFSPTEFKADPKIRTDRVRLKGKIAPGSVKMSGDKMDLWFDIGDDKEKIPVHYHGAIPDAFQEGLEAVVDGRMGKDGLFEGKELIVKCPSKYESQGAAKPEAPAEKR